MPQLCTVCTHTDRKEIDLAIVRGELSNRRIATQFGVTESALRRHRIEHLAPVVQQAQAELKQADKIDLNAELAKGFRRVNLLFDACHSWLQDPDDPEKYFIGPRSEEMTVVYEEVVGVRDDGTPITKQRSALLSELLIRVEKHLGISTLNIRSKHADPRKLLLDAAKTLSEQIERVGKYFGLFHGALDRDRLEAMRNAVSEIQRRLKDEYKRDFTWGEAIDEILRYQGDASNRPYLMKLKEESSAQGQLL